MGLTSNKNTNAQNSSKLINHIPCLLSCLLHVDRPRRRLVVVLVVGLVMMIALYVISFGRPAMIETTGIRWPMKIKQALLSAQQLGGISRTTDFSDAGQEGLVKRLPRAIIIGVKKCGTGALISFLQAHHRIRAAKGEPHFFDWNYNKGLEWYRQRMPASHRGQITIEKSPRYFVTTSAPEHIRNMSSDVRLICIVRDPTTRALSDYTHERALGKNRLVSGTFEQNVFINNTTTVNKTWSVVNTGIYALHLERWLMVFPRSQIHFVDGERLITDPAGQVGAVLDFLGLERVITDRYFHLNATKKGFPCLQKLNGNSSSLQCLGRNKGRSHPVVDPLAWKQLQHFYRPFNEDFYRMTGIDFGWA